MSSIDREIQPEERAVIDFDKESRQHGENWEEEYRSMRSGCPVAWTESSGGYWVTSRYADVARVGRDPETFSSAKHYDLETGEITGGVMIPPVPKQGSLPVESDPPEWKIYRDILNPFFGPRMAESWRPWAEALADRLLDDAIAAGHLDIVHDYTSPLPTLLTLEMLGIEVDDWKKFVEPVHSMMYTKRDTPEFDEAMRGIHWIEDQLLEEIRRCRTRPGEGIIATLAAAEVDGQPIDDEIAQRMAMLVVTGGAHTTTALTSNVLHHLATNEAHRRRLVEEPEILELAREEFVRFFSPVHSIARTIKKDVELGGQQLRAGEHLIMSFCSANRDEKEFEAPDEIILDRFPNRHLGFGIGIHRCLGSFVAKMMFEVIISKFLARVPRWSIINDRARRYGSVGAINGWETMPAQLFNPS